MIASKNTDINAQKGSAVLPFFDNEWRSNLDAQTLDAVWDECYYLARFPG
jgi:hypothetical protein